PPAATSREMSMNDQSEDELRNRIDDTRAHLGHTIEQIGDQINPDRVRAELKARASEEVDEVKNNVKRKARTAMRNVEHGVSDTGRGIWETIRDNPLPAGMVGAGIAWLAAASRKNGHDRDFDARGQYGAYGL